mmetsp:Transcript_5570/g.13953  ORF Transcript_5570/g.13953 Transcript_5570/m.13953 type:complete len:105 (-) Transcript_5570:347-661(-)
MGIVDLQLIEYYETVRSPKNHQILKRSSKVRRKKMNETQCTLIPKLRVKRYETRPRIELILLGLMRQEDSGNSSSEFTTAIFYVRQLTVTGFRFSGVLYHPLVR